MSKLILPSAALEQHTAVLGKTGSGKTYTAKAVIVEPLLERAAHVGLVDPTDAWWGLRSSRDGKGAGYPVLVLGGPHGDLPLPANGGEAVARLLIEQRVNLIACTKGLTVGERTRWAIAFFGTINRLNQRPLYLVVDEAHQFAPQGKVPDPDTGRMLHEVNTLASGGRGIGVRLTMITQRPQKLHKDTLTCADTLIALRVLAPHDRDAVKAWIDGCGDPAQGKQVLDSLAQLKRGEGWVWYPEGAHLERSKFPQIKTFDSSATPQAGHEVAAPKKAADVNLDAIRTALADAVKEAEANDPKLLRAEISRLKAELSKKPSAATTAAAARAPAGPRSEDVATITALRKALENAMKLIVEINTKDFFKAAGESVDQAQIERAIASATEAVKKMLQAHIDHRNQEFAKLKRQGERLVESMQALLEGDITLKVDVRHNEPFTVSPAPARRQQALQRAPAGPGEPLAKAERLVLAALAQYPQGRTKVQVAILTGYAVNGGGFNNAIGALRSACRIDGGSDRLTITAAGVEALGAFEPLPRGAALLEHWYGQLGKAERKALEALVEVYPRTLSKTQIAARAGYEEGGGGFNNALGKLRSLELIRGRGEMTASEDLFDG